MPYPRGICSICLEYKALKSKGICPTCYVKYLQPKGICSNCGETKNIKDKEQQLCANCYKSIYRIKHPDHSEPCSICNSIKPVQQRIDGKPICRKCYKQPERKCSKCGISSIICVNIDDKPICKKCYEQPKYICCKCGELKEICWRDGDIALCDSCRPNKKKECCICHKIKDVSTRTENGVICGGCRFKERLLVEPHLKIIKLLRSRLRNALLSKGLKKNKKADEFGINYNAIVEHLKPFPENIKEYHIDHIIPISAFDFNDPKQIAAAFAPENHQWLLKKENLKKGAKR